MSLFGELKADVETKAPASAFYTFFYSKLYELPDVSPDKVKISGLLDGTWGKVGAVVYQKMVLEGKTEAVKFEVVAADEEKKAITYQIVEGTNLEYYKSFKILIHVVAKGEGSVVHWALEYEKINEKIAEPYTFLDFFVNITKDVEAYLVK